MSKQTAVEWFLNEFSKQIEFVPESELDKWYKDLIPKAKEMEREQIIRAANNGCKGMCMIDTSRDGKNYYNETYGGQDEN